MPERGDADPFTALVEELRQLDGTELMVAWKALRAQLEDRAHSFPEGHRLRLRHYAFRKVAVERFGSAGHVERYRAVSGG